MRTPNRPLTPHTTRSPGSTKFATIASMPALPVPEIGSVARFSVPNASRMSVIVSPMMSAKAGSM